MKKILVLLLVLMLGFSLTGCDSGGGENGPDSYEGYWFILAELDEKRQGDGLTEIPVFTSLSADGK